MESWTNIENLQNGASQTLLLGALVLYLTACNECFQECVLHPVPGQLPVVCVKSHEHLNQFGPSYTLV